MITVTGTLTEGVEPSCILLKTETALYLLLGKSGTLVHATGTASVRGRVNKNIRSYCQQGIPFEVTEVVSAPSGS